MMEIIEHYFEALPSTNLYAKEHLLDFPKDKITLISTDDQLLGRGRFGRKWVSGKGENLTCSFAFFIDEANQDLLSLTHVLAISLVEVLDKRGVKARIKWPNDILVEQKKISGILCETQHHPPYFGVVIGVGLNVNMRADVLEHVGQPATSIYEETSQVTDIQGLKKEISEKFGYDLDLFLKEGFLPFTVRFRQYILPSQRIL